MLGRDVNKSIFQDKAFQSYSVIHSVERKISEIFLDFFIKEMKDLMFSSFSRATCRGAHLIILVTIKNNPDKTFVVLPKNECYRKAWKSMDNIAQELSFVFNFINYQINFTNFINFIK